MWVNNLPSAIATAIVAAIAATTVAATVAATVEWMNIILHRRGRYHRHLHLPDVK